MKRMESCDAVNAVSVPRSASRPKALRKHTSMAHQHISTLVSKQAPQQPRYLSTVCLRRGLTFRARSTLVEYASFSMKELASSKEGPASTFDVPGAGTVIEEVTVESASQGEKAGGLPICVGDVSSSFAGFCPLSSGTPLGITPRCSRPISVFRVAFRRRNCTSKFQALTIAIIFWERSYRRELSESQR